MIETEAYQLGELCTLVSRGITPRYTENIENSCIILNQRCIRDYQINSDNARMHDLSKRKISTDKILKTFDVLVNSTGVGTLGRVAQYLSTKNQMISVDSHVTIIRPNIHKIDALYFGYLIKSKQSIIENLGQGSTGQTELSKEAIKELSVLVIKDKNIQNNISNFLLNIDNKITLNTQTNQTLEQIAQAIFKHWFIDFAPVHAKANALARGETIEQAELAAMACLSGKTAEKITALKTQDPTAYQQLQQTAQAFPSEFVESEMGLVPKGWEVKKVKNIGKVICGKTPSKAKEEFYGDDIPFIKIPDMHNNIFITNTSDKLSLLGAESQKNKFIEKGSICISCIATVGIVSIASRSSQTNQQINSIIPNSEILTEFLYLYFSQENTKSYLKILASGGSTTLNLNTTAFSNIKLLVPDEYLLAQFHRKTSSTFNKILLNYKENNSLQKIRDELLPKLLNGEIEL